MPDTHSKLAPSSASRWLACPGSAGADSEGGEAADLGTRIHEAIEHAFQGNPYVADDDEVHECVEAWLDVVPEGALTEINILSEEIPDFGGTVDALFVDNTQIHVFDMKTGKVPVEARNNPQLGCYLLLAKERFPGRERFFGTIVQPLSGRTSTWEFTAASLALLKEKILQCVGSESLKAGSHCTYCPLLTASDNGNGCSEAHNEMYRILEAFGLEPLPADVPVPEELGPYYDLLEFFPALEQLEAKARVALLDVLQAGKKIPGYKAGKWSPARVWANEEQAVNYLKEHTDLGESDLYEKKMKSPAKIEKLIEKLPEDLVIKPSGKRILARKASRVPDDDDPRGAEFDAWEET